jgi:hypothetical protein
MGHSGPPLLIEGPLEWVHGVSVSFHNILLSETPLSYSGHPTLAGPDTPSDCRLIGDDNAPSSQRLAI